MNPSIDALLDLQVLDKQRLALKRAREERLNRLTDAEKSASSAAAETTAAAAEVEKLGALIRQYTADVARCEATINDLRSKQMNAKTNKEYMAIINGIETAKSEKANREQSVKDLAARVAEREAKVAAAKEHAEKLSARRGELVAANDTEATPEEVELQRQYDERKAKVDPKFLEVYERLIKANHKMPLMRVDPKSRSTAFGSVLSHNQVEQIRMGKLVIDRSNAILYIVDREKSSEGEAKG